MSAATAKKKLDERIESLARKLNRLKALRDAFDDDDIVEEVGQLFGDNGTPRPSGRLYKSKNMEKIAKFFEKRENAKATIKQMCKAMGMSPHSLRQIIYRTHIDEFEREGQLGGGRESLFWMTGKKV